MRTNEERISELHQRSAHLKQERKSRLFTLICAADASVCLIILFVFSGLVSRVSQNSLIDGTSEGMNASIFSGSSVLGYMVITILAFLLGIIVTIFCFRLKRYLDDTNHEDFR